MLGLVSPGSWEGLGIICDDLSADGFLAERQGGSAELPLSCTSASLPFFSGRWRGVLIDELLLRAGGSAGGFSVHEVLRQPPQDKDRMTGGSAGHSSDL